MLSCLSYLLGYWRWTTALGNNAVWYADDKACDQHFMRKLWFPADYLKTHCLSVSLTVDHLNLPLMQHAHTSNQAFYIDCYTTTRHHCGDRDQYLSSTAFSQPWRLTDYPSVCNRSLQLSWPGEEFNPTLTSSPLSPAWCLLWRSILDSQVRLCMSPGRLL